MNNRNLNWITSFLVTQVDLRWEGRLVALSCTGVGVSRQVFRQWLKLDNGQDQLIVPQRIENHREIHLFLWRLVRVLQLTRVVAPR